MPQTSRPYWNMADLVTARMTALSPGQSPPPVRTPIRLMGVDIRERFLVCILSAQGWSFVIGRWSFVLRFRFVVLLRGWSASAGLGDAARGAAGDGPSPGVPR